MRTSTQDLAGQRVRSQSIENHPISRLRGRILRERPTYHVFSYRDRTILYDLVTGWTFEPSPPAAILLRGLEEGLTEEEIEIALSGIGFPMEGLDPLAREIEVLAQEGLFGLEPLDSASTRNETMDILHSHHPNKMMLLVQTSCNLRCNYCYEVKSAFHQMGNRMSWDTAREAVEHLIRRSGPRKELQITFFGGEPLLNFPLIRQTVEYCEGREETIAKKFFYSITTNATLLTDPIIDFFVRERFTVMVSLDGPPEKNDLHRIDHAGRGAGEKTIANARKLLQAQKKAGIRPASVRATMTKENHDVNALGDYFASQGFRKINLGASTGTAFAKDPWDISGEALKEVQNQQEIMLDRYLEAVEKNRSVPPGELFSESLRRTHEALMNPRRRAMIGCGVARNMQAITADGKIFPCHRYAGVASFQIGKLGEGLQKEKVDDYYHRLLEGYDRHCSHCWARFQCGGQCPWYLSKPTGEITAPDEESCNGIRRRTEQTIWLYHELREKHPGFLKRVLSIHEEEDDEA